MDKKESEKVMEIMTSYERKGMEKGREEGIEEGIEKGREDAIMEVAKRLIKKSMPINDVMDATGLAKNVVEQLIQEVNENN